MQRPNGRLSFVSRTAFEALAVDEGEDDESEELELPEETVNEPVNEESAPPVVPVKQEPRTPKAAPAPVLKKSAAKKTKSRETTQAVSPIGTSLPNGNGISSPSAPTVAPAGSQRNPLPIVDEDTAVTLVKPANAVNGEVSVDHQQEEATKEESKFQESEIPYKDESISLEVIDSEGNRRNRNLEIHVSSSAEIMSPPPKAPGESLLESMAAPNKKRANIITRSFTTFLMIGGFIGFLLLGHIYMIVLVFICQTLVYREVTTLFALSHKDSSDQDEEEHGDPWSKTLNWYFFAVTNYFLYGETIIYYFKHVVFADVLFLPFVTHHRFISFSLYCIGFVGFVGSLKKQYLKRQFSLFGWVHMTLLLVVVSSHFIVNNILEGLIWFWVPASLVICNDIFAYIWGVTTGRTPLIKLSPKKTVEGFVGAFFSTLIFSYVWGTFFMRFNYMICPVYDLGVTAFDDVNCKPNTVFVWRQWRVPIVVMLPFFGRITTVWWAPYQFHLLVMACFASLVAPFGGFFASGFKRAFNIKDFGDSIPGHGGMTDRMDCQFLMGLFSYVYFSTSIRDHHITVGSLLQSIVSGLTLEEQMQLLGDLKRYVEGRGIVV